MSKYVTEGLKKQLKSKDDVFELISGIAVDYDGCKTISDLKDLIDEMREIADYGRHEIE